jgi:D-alanyl-D-alanine endopeptidase (penicillin-binding protein 7)
MRSSGERGGALRTALAAVVAAGLCLADGAAAQQPAVAQAPAKARHPDIKSSVALVVEQNGGRTIYAKNTSSVVAIASITKIMTAIVVLDAGLDLSERIAITTSDVDDIKGTRSRLRVGSVLTREELMRLALMSSENRAAAALTRAYPGGRPAFIAAMNRKASELGMRDTRFVDGTGLSGDNVSTAEDLARLLAAAYRYDRIRQFTTDDAYTVGLANGGTLEYRNSNRLIYNPEWRIGLSKTGYISEAGRCLVMQAVIAQTPVLIVLLDSWGTLTRIGDANRIRRWMESNVASEPGRRPEG